MYLLFRYDSLHYDTMSHVAIITERLSSLSYDFAEKHKITLLPANAIENDTIVKDDSDEKADAFLRRLDPKKDIPSTAVPAVGEILPLFEKATKDTGEAICISSSKKLTAFSEVARKTAKLMEKKGKHIEVFDSELTLSALGFMAYEASLRAQKGESLQDIIQYLTTLRDDNRMVEYGIIETLKFLEKNGRIGKAQAWLGGIFSFKPIISIKDGELEPVTRVRTNDQALETLIRLTHEKMKNFGSKNLKIMFDYGLSNEYIKQKALPRFQKEFNAEIISINQFSILIGCHLGPQAWGIALYFV